MTPKYNTGLSLPIHRSMLNRHSLYCKITYIYTHPMYYINIVNIYCTEHIIPERCKVGLVLFTCVQKHTSILLSFHTLN